MGLVDFNIIAHLGAEWHTSATDENAEIWANKVPVPTYAIDDSSGVMVADGKVEVVTEGKWLLFNG
jgi:dipeptidase E